jgi:hypothetical protein
MGRIESYFIYYTDDVLTEDRAQLFEDLYNKILKKDDKWHFFYEGKFDELRFHSKFRRRVERFLDKDGRIRGYAQKDGGWEDDHDIVEEYKEYFTSVFHQNSLIAIQLSNRDELASDSHLQKIMDRVVHSFFNMIYPDHGKLMLEINVMKNYLVDRAFYTGMVWQSMKERKDE